MLTELKLLKIYACNNDKCIYSNLKFYMYIKSHHIIILVPICSGMHTHTRKHTQTWMCTCTLYTDWHGQGVFNVPGSSGKIFHPAQQAMHEAGVSKPSRIIHLWRRLIGTAEHTIQAAWPEWLKWNGRNGIRRVSNPSKSVIKLVMSVETFFSFLLVTGG